MVGISSSIWASEDQSVMLDHPTKPPYKALFQGHHDTFSHFQQGIQKHL
jgi:hypothetical protein